MAHLSDDDRTTLVAYLDGELDDAAAHALEARLNLDPVLRAEADALKRTWELLDYLPRQEPSPSFTNRTLERLAIRDSGKGQPPRGVRRRVWPQVVAWAAAVLVAVGVGRFGAPWLFKHDTPPPPDTGEVEEQIARHLRILENRRLYDPVDDLEFVRGLDSPDLFGDDG